MIDLIEYALENKVSVSIIPTSEYPLTYKLRMFKEGSYNESYLDESTRSHYDMDDLILSTLNRMLRNLNTYLGIHEDGDS